MDVFSRTYQPATGVAGMPVGIAARHLAILRRCVEPDDAVLLAARALRPDRPLGREFLILLTYRRLIITQESRVVHRMRLHLNSELRHLSNVTWHPDPRMASVEFAVTAVDGVRERFWIHAGDPRQVWHLDALFSLAFKPRGTRYAVADLTQLPTRRPGLHTRRTAVPPRHPTPAT